MVGNRQHDQCDGSGKKKRKEDELIDLKRMRAEDSAGPCETEFASPR
ncbi:unnamed protein product [marine sediment metagenome]|uniref:Uncharacterized protein n=1 Tax=marine sediment metagenome TaxID=412755 RepID=X0ZVZ4_9ZZZZ